MTTSDTERRLAYIRNDPITEGMTDGQLIYRLDMAVRKALDYTHQPADIGEGWDGVVIELAINAILMSGAENTTQVSEGGISRAWSDIPDNLKGRLNAYRLLVGVKG